MLLLMVGRPPFLVEVTKRKNRQNQSKFFLEHNCIYGYI